MEKFYKAYQSAEESSSGVVALTDEEYKAVEKFLKQVHAFISGWCGSCGIDPEAFKTENEACESLYKEEN